jgi:hypothetical protein
MTGSSVNILTIFFWSMNMRCLPILCVCLPQCFVIFHLSFPWLNTFLGARCLWLTFIILVTWEAEIRRTEVWGQGGEFPILPSQPIAGCSGSCLSSQAMQEAEIRRVAFPGQRVCEIPSQWEKNSVWWWGSVIPVIAGSLK